MCSFRSLTCPARLVENAILDVAKGGPQCMRGCACRDRDYYGVGCSMTLVLLDAHDVRQHRVQEHRTPFSGTKKLFKVQ
jgi:hypothetical protein